MLATISSGGTTIEPLLRNGTGTTSMQEDRDRNAVRLRAENHVRNHVKEARNGVVGQVYAEMHDAGREVELVCLEESDFEASLGERSRNRAIRERLHECFRVEDLRDFQTDGLSEVVTGPYRPEDGPAILREALDLPDLRATAYVLWLTERAILAARVEDLIPHVETILGTVSRGLDVYILDERAGWLVQFNRHGRYTFGRRFE